MNNMTQFQTIQAIIEFTLRMKEAKKAKTAANVQMWASGIGIILAVVVVAAFVNASLYCQRTSQCFLVDPTTIRAALGVIVLGMMVFAIGLVSEKSAMRRIMEEQAELDDIREKMDSVTR